MEIKWAYRQVIFFGRSKSAQTTQTSPQGWSEYFGDREDLIAVMHRSESREVALGTAMLGITAIAAGALLVGTVCSGADPSTLAMLAASVPLAGGMWAMRQQAKDRLETTRYHETRDWEKYRSGYAEPGDKRPPSGHYRDPKNDPKVTPGIR